MAEAVKKKRIGVHLGTAGGCWTAVNRAVEVGANTFQIFSASPRMWKAGPVKEADAAKMRELRARYDVGPVSIHASYLINMCSQTEAVRENSIGAFRGEGRTGAGAGCGVSSAAPGKLEGIDAGRRAAAGGAVD